MNFNAIIYDLKFHLEEDICDLKGDNDFFLSFNTNQISKIARASQKLKIYMDTDISIIIEKY